MSKRRLRLRLRLWRGGIHPSDHDRTGHRRRATLSRTDHQRPLRAPTRGHQSPPRTQRRDPPRKRQIRLRLLPHRNLRLRRRPPRIPRPTPPAPAPHLPHPNLRPPPPNLRAAQPPQSHPLPHPLPPAPLPLPRRLPNLRNHNALPSLHPTHHHLLPPTPPPPPRARNLHPPRLPLLEHRRPPRPAPNPLPSPSKPSPLAKNTTAAQRAQGGVDTPIRFVQRGRRLERLVLSGGRAIWVRGEQWVFGELLHDGCERRGVCRGGRERGGGGVDGVVSCWGAGGGEFVEFFCEVR